MISQFSKEIIPKEKKGDDLKSASQQEHEDFANYFKSLYSLLRKITAFPSSASENPRSLLLNLRDLFAKSKIFGGLEFSHLFTPAENYAFRQKVTLNFLAHYAFTSSQQSIEDLASSSHMSDCDALTEILMELKKLPSLSLLGRYEQNTFSSVSLPILPEPSHWNSNTSPEQFNELDLYYRLFMGSANALIEITKNNVKRYPYKEKFNNIQYSFIKFLEKCEFHEFIVDRTISHCITFNTKKMALCEDSQKEMINGVYDKISTAVSKYNEVRSGLKPYKHSNDHKSKQGLSVPKNTPKFKITQRSTILDKQPIDCPEKKLNREHPLISQINDLLQANSNIPLNLEKLVYDFRDYINQVGEFQPTSDHSEKDQVDINFLKFMAKCYEVCKKPKQTYPITHDKDRSAHLKLLRMTLQKQISAIQSKITRSTQQSLRIPLQQSKTVLSFFFNHLNYHSVFFDRERFLNIITTCEALEKKMTSQGQNTSKFFSSSAFPEAVEDLLDQCFALKLTSRNGRGYYSTSDLFLYSRWLNKEICSNLRVVVPFCSRWEEAEHLISRVKLFIPFIITTGAHLFTRRLEPSPISDSRSGEEYLPTPIEKTGWASSLYEAKEKFAPSAVPDELKPVFMSSVEIYYGEGPQIIRQKSLDFLTICALATLLDKKDLPIKSEKISIDQLSDLQSLIKKNLAIFYKNKPFLTHAYTAISKKISSFFEDAIKVLRFHPQCQQHYARGTNAFLRSPDEKRKRVLLSPDEVTSFDENIANHKFHG